MPISHVIGCFKCSSVNTRQTNEQTNAAVCIKHIVNNDTQSVINHMTGQSHPISCDMSSRHSHH